MDPITLSLLTSSIFGGLGGLFGGSDGQERRPYEGDLEASNVLGEARNAGRAGLDAFADQLGRGVRLRSAYAQTPPTFTGGGLPFPIGVNAQDPALADPDLLSLPGVDLTGYLRNWASAGLGNTPGGASPQADTTFPNGSPAPTLRRASAPSQSPPRGPGELTEDELLALQLLGTS